MDLLQADEIYRKKLEENPQFDHEMVMTFREEMPKEFADVMYMCEYGLHIMDEDYYNMAVSCLENKDGSKGSHWDINTIKNRSGINFDNEDFSLYDYAYVVNMLYSDYGNIFSDTSYYLKMAHNYLSDEDYYGDASERAFKDAKCRIKYFREE